MRERLDGLYDEPRPGAPRQISDEDIEQVIVRTLEHTPRGETHWSSRGMAHAKATPFVWTKSADEILASIARFAQRTLDFQAAPLIYRRLLGVAARLIAQSTDTAIVTTALPAQHLEDARLLNAGDPS